MAAAAPRPHPTPGAAARGPPAPGPPHLRRAARSVTPGCRRPRLPPPRRPPGGHHGAHHAAARLFRTPFRRRSAGRCPQRPAGRGGVPAPERKDGRETEAAEEGAAMAVAALCLPSQRTTRRFGRPELPHIPIPFILILIPTFSSLRTESGVKVKAERGEERELRRFFSSDSALFFVVFPLPVPHHAAGRRHRVRELSLKYTFYDKGSNKVKK